jgi:pimeloyl-ACP methyl ester carboxylesterase
VRDAELLQARGYVADHGVERIVGPRTRGVDRPLGECIAETIDLSGCVQQVDQRRDVVWSRIVFERVPDLLPIVLEAGGLRIQCCLYPSHEIEQVVDALRLRLRVAHQGSAQAPVLDVGPLREVDQLRQRCWLDVSGHGEERTLPAMTTFVLVHGAMHGGWVWRDVARELRSQGHDVFTPTLTGQGDRSHLRTPQTGIDTHVADLVAVLEFEDLTDVHLVLHSYAGVLAGPVAERCADRISSVVHLGAFIVRPGESLLDVEPPDVAARYRELAAGSATGDVVPASLAFLDQWGVTDPVARDWVGPRLSGFPLPCATDPVDFDDRALAGLGQVYVRHTSPPLASLALSFDRARDAGWETHELACGHDVMVQMPRETASLLVSIGAARGEG